MAIAKKIAILWMGLFVVCESACALTEYADIPANIPRIDNNYVKAIAVGTTHVYVGGSFTTVSNGTVRAALAAFDKTTGALDVNWDPGLADPVDLSVEALAVADGKVYVGGRFKSVRGGLRTRNNLAAFSEADGNSPAGVDFAWDPNMDKNVYAIAVFGNRVYVGGAFEYVTASSVQRRGAAAFNKADGSSAAVLDPWNPRLSYPDLYPWMGDWPVVNAFAFAGDRVHLGGEFTKANTSIVRNYLAAFELANGSNPGTVDAAWNPNLDDAVNTLAISDGRLYAGGDFTTVNGGAATRNRVAAFNVAGGGASAMVDPWNPNINSTVWAVAVSGPRVFVGGTFSAVGGSTTRYALAAFNTANGSNPAVLDAWNPSSSSSNYIFTLAPSRSAGIIVGGSFTYMGHETRRRIAGFNTDWDNPPYVMWQMPASGGAIGSSHAAIDVTFNEPVYGVDAGDLILTGPAATGAVVGTPTFQHGFTGSTPRTMWRFPVLNLSSGTLNVSLSPTVGAIVDEAGSTLNPSPTTSTYTVTATPATLPFFEDFESGSLASYWDSRGTAYFGNTVTSLYDPHAGSYHLLLDEALTGYLSRNEVTLTLDLAGRANVELSFWMKELLDDDHGPPSIPYLNGADYDGVAISADGLMWYEIQGLRTADGISGSYTQFTIDLDAAAAAHGLAYNNHFQIRFNHYDNWPASSSGFVFDDIRVREVVTTPAVVNVTSQHPNGTFPLGEVVDVQVVFSTPVAVMGSPTLELETGAVNRLAAMIGGDGTNTLVFRYTVQAGDSSPDLDYAGSDALQLNGGSIRDAATGTLDADLALPIPGEANSLGFNKNIAIDTVAPSVGTLEVQAPLVMNLSYNQAMGTGVLDPARYTLSGLGQGSLANHPDQVEDLGGNVYKLSWAGGEMRTGHDVTVTVTDVFDLIGNPIGPSNSATHTEGGMGVAPTVTGIMVQSGRFILVEFSETMGSGAILASNYTLAGSGKGTLAANPNDVQWIADNEYRLEWTTGEMRDGGDIVISVSNAVDLVGNGMGDPDSGTHPGGGIGYAPELAEVDVQDESHIDLIFNEDMGAGVADVDHFTVSGPGAGSLTMHPSSVEALGASYYRLAWSSGEMRDGGDVTVTAANVHDRAGNPIGPLNFAVDIGGGIGIPPGLADATVMDLRMVLVVFSEWMGSDAVNAENYTLSGSGRGTLAEHPNSVEDTGMGMYRLQWASGEMLDGGDITITASGVADLVGNPIGTAHTATDPGAGIGGAPRVTSVQVLTGSTVRLSFNEPMMGGDLGDASRYMVSGDGMGTLSIHPDTITTEGSSAVVAGWNEGEMRQGGSISLTAANVRDLAGNLIGASNSATHADGGMGVPPTGMLVLNDAAVFTRDRQVTATFLGADGTGSALDAMRFGNGVAEWSDWRTYSVSSAWELPDGQSWKTVYAQLRDAAGNVSDETIADTIALDTEPLALSPGSDTAVEAEYGSSCLLEVRAEGIFGTPLYTWSKRNNEGQWQILSGPAKDVTGSQYWIAPVTVSSAGAYRCEAADETETAGPVEFIVTVSDPLESLPLFGFAGILLLALCCLLAGFTCLRKFSC
ncbi:MAG TPA: immunoglobulin domain-containing protein [Candidatus Hydrogenedentes bacterium]|nr:immunoglobulin domain-containing protein [Candidatus Hydrogenedentota bacterium]HRT20153.1 immunoglobulin domain-containing protein [Candidatus Hydrogenedentota bacterium]HRT63187.1 immunoglobulin domain-containing protein [Candidatus Hydrogenedentota bacterium]